MFLTKVAISLLACFCAAPLIQGRPEPPASQYGVPGGSGGGYGSGRPGGDDLAADTPYDFAYQVKDAESGNDFGHMESGMGHNAKGTYYVLLPDGRMQKVDYTADEGGYKPVVSYSGEAKYGPGVGGGKAGGGGGGAAGGYFYRR